MELKNKVESILFSTGKRVHIDEIVKLCHSKKEDVEQALKELKDEYDTKEDYSNPPPAGTSGNDGKK